MLKFLIIVGGWSGIPPSHVVSIDTPVRVALSPQDNDEGHDNSLDLMTPPLPWFEFVGSKNSEIAKVLKAGTIKR